ncbi:uncharacterized protein [Montipora capricornis]|uniref:uncharacterized protein n=1 Tax=Montipora capricornis TaxID=246305 RepID=UPI0035F1CEAD
MSMKKATKLSERLQMRRLREDNPEAFLQKDMCIIFFVAELRYSLVERKSIDEGAQLMSTVEVKDGTTKYMGTLMFIGTKTECLKRMEALENCQISDGCSSAATNAPPIRKSKKKGELG